MGPTNCMNEVCRAAVSTEWKKGWTLKSGGFATLCYNCGSAYENSMFCETFHSDEAGWRNCKMCKKRIHCGCIASRYLHEYLDLGGICCASCVKHLEMHSVQPMQVEGGIPNGTFVTNGIRDIVTRDIRPIIENKMQDDRFSTERLLQLTKAIQVKDNPLHQQPKREDFMLRIGESSRRFPNFIQPYTPSSSSREKGKGKQGVKDMYESPAQPSPNYSLCLVPFSVGVAEQGEQNNGSSQQGQRARHILPKPVKPSPVEGSDNNTKNNSNNNNTNNSSNNNTQAIVCQPRVPRPPVDGRGRNQLLPRYWPKYTDQELEEISGDLNSPVVPLFEKILSASDAGRIGRLVLPKACAEAYFPAINQSEGIPIKVMDTKGKEWTFQFRFWPNNNSRMYVLEGVTPCIQTFQLQAGDTVIFSRTEPERKLVIGCRKATSDAQEPQATYVPNGESAAETSFAGAIENVQSNGGKASDHMSISEKKKPKTMKNKRLLMHSEDAMELKVTWEEAQELLRPSPDSEPAITIVEEHEFEEFQEPPVFGKKTIFTYRPSGEQGQLAQCDTCSKWRKLPVNALLSAKWTCSDNIWDSNRSSCSAPEDLDPQDLEYYFGINQAMNYGPDSKQRRISENKLLTEGEPSGLDALATAAVLGDNMVEIGEFCMGATTRHPRHRPGCTCIVCIQPPSGKGKHEPSCKCNVCLSVKRRFKTLMMRKKKRQSEREAELAQEKDKNALAAKVALEGDSIAGLALLDIKNTESEINGGDMDMEEAEKEGLDLNFDPQREDERLAEAAGMSLTTLMNAATLPAEMFAEESEVPTVTTAALPAEMDAEESEVPSAATLPTEMDAEESEVPTVMTAETLPAEMEAEESEVLTVTKAATLPAEMNAVASEVPAVTEAATLPAEMNAVASEVPTLTNAATLPAEMVAVESKVPTVTNAATLPAEMDAEESEVLPVKNAATLPPAKDAEESEVLPVKNAATLPAAMDAEKNEVPPTVTNAATLPAAMDAEKNEVRTVTNPATLPATMEVEESEVPTLKPSLVSGNGVEDGEKSVADEGLVEKDVKPESNRESG